MALGFLKHTGSFLLLAGAVLLLISTITSPVVDNLSLMRVYFNEDTQQHASFGTFGYCDLTKANSGSTYCTPSVLGYSPLDHIRGFLNPQANNAWSSATFNSTSTLTRALILHPIACGLAFLAFFLSLPASILLSLLAAILGALAWLASLAGVIVTFVLFGIVKRRVERDTPGRASYQAGTWTALAGMLVLFIGAVLVLLTCASGRRDRRRNRGVVGAKHDSHVHGGTTHVTTRRRWYQRRNRY